MNKVISFRLFTFTVLVGMILFAGCALFSGDSDNDFEMEANVEGQSWKGSSTAGISSSDVLFIRGQQGNDDCNHESISIVMAGFEGTGDYPIYNNSYAQLIGCDGVASFGHSFDSTGTATITHFDAESAVIEGEFQFQLIARYDHENLRNGELFKVSGRFRAKIEPLITTQE